MKMHSQDNTTDIVNASWRSNSTTRDENYYYMDVDHHLPANMELDRSFISNYDEYIGVLKDCNRSIHRKPYPKDGKCIVLLYKICF